ncbi:MAG: S8 family serine peptidase [Deltaproteobacteria bacterium]|nr:S8 family serine peptidase [Deltaproteobacteria bacterium]
MKGRVIPTRHGLGNVIKHHIFAGIALACVFAFGHAEAETAGLIDSSLQSGRLSAAVFDQITETGEAEVLVTLGVEEIREAAAEKRRDMGLRADSADTVQEKAMLYGEKKEALLSKLSSVDCEVLNDYSHFPVLHIRLNEKALTKILEHGNDIQVTENKALHTCLNQSLSLIGATQAHSMGATGSGTSVAVLDTGLDYTRSAFGNCSGGPGSSGCKVAYVQDFAPEDNQLDDDTPGLDMHGTNVSGIVVGVAPDAEVLGLDVFDGFSAWGSDILEALNWVLDNRDTYNIASVNMSLGDGAANTSPCTGAYLGSAVEDLRAAGIATVIAAGNEGYKNAVSWPACLPAAISVGAVYDANVGGISWSTCTDSTTSADKITCFSNFASFMTLLAPGAIIDAADIEMGGTSQASPHVAGAVAVMRSEDPGISVDEIVSVLSSTGTWLSDTRTGGSGDSRPRIDLYDAVLQLPLGYPLTVSKSGSGAGTVTSVNAAHGIDCGADCSETYDDVTVVTLRATPDSDSDFVGWSGAGCSGTGDCTVTVDGAKSVTGTFDVEPPDANFTASVIEGTAPLQVDFTDTSSGSPTSWEWDFEYSSQTVMSTARNPTYTYTEEGVYAVSLTASNDSGTDTETKTTYITVNACPYELVMTGGSTYATLQEAYAAAADQGAILVHAGQFSTDLDLNMNKTVTFDWGWNCDYSSSTHEGGIYGVLTISRGTLTVECKTIIGM